MSNSELTLERYAPEFQTPWDSVVASARSQHFMFRRAYMDYHQDRFEDASWILFTGSDPIAVFPASRDGDMLTSHGGLTFGGLLSDERLGLAQTIAALDLLIAELANTGIRTLEYKPMPHPYQRLPADEDLYALHALGATVVKREVTTAIPPRAEVRTSQERRRGLRRFRQLGLEVSESDDVERFALLLRNVLASRHNAAPVHSADELRLLKDRFPENIRLFVTASPDDDELLAGVLIFQTATVAHAQYIAASDAGRESAALDGIFDHLIHERYPHLWFDFGISNGRTGELNVGLLRNKEGYGGRTVLHDRYRLDVARAVLS